jgi:RNA-directed DNA polymerase
MNPLTKHGKGRGQKLHGWLEIECCKQTLYARKTGSLAEKRKAFMPKSAEEPAASRQSPHSSEEASNDRGAKEGRKKESERAMEEETNQDEVLERAKHSGEASIPFSDELGAEPCLWTDRMLAALKSGVKGGKWFSLHDKTSTKRVLERAWQKVKARGGRGGIDQVEIEHFEKRLEEELERLSDQLRESRYQPAPVKRVWIPKMGSQEKRPLGIPTIRDRVVQSALQMTIGPIFEIGFHPQSYGFRPWRGCKEALRRVDQLLKSGNEWVVDVDLKGYFDTIDHDLLMKQIEKKIADGGTLDLIRRFLKAGVMESHRDLQPTKRGTPQGAVMSPLLSNIYLDELDWKMSERGHEMVRYADDFVVLCASKEEAEAALEQIRQWAAERKLEVHPEKTRIVHHQDPGGFEFLGYRFEAGKRYPRKKSYQKMREAVRQKTPRSNGHSLREIIAELNPMLRGWFGYFQHSYKTVFESTDGFVRRRLRAILAERNGIKYHEAGRAHQLWPKAYFKDTGLISLQDLYLQACQSRG